MLAVCITALTGLCLGSVQAQAHKVNAFAYLEGDRVVVEGYFGAGVKARDSRVTVLDEGGKQILEGRTDDKGIYSFKPADVPQFSGGLKIVLDIGEGHRAEYLLSASDLPSPAGSPTLSKEEPPKNKSEAAPGPNIADSTRLVDQPGLMAAMESLMDKKLEPVVRMLGKQERLLLEQKQAGPRMTDIVGGIGWIVGLTGLVAFFWGRSRSTRKSAD